MAKIREYLEIALDDLVIGKGQIRTVRSDADLAELVTSIKVQGLLQPIVVCEAQRAGKWEILAGQRRFLAIKQLVSQGQWSDSTVTAAVLDERVDPGQAKAISITENLVRRKLSGKELIDGVTFLYKQYGSIKAVVEATGLSQRSVSQYVKYPRLVPRLKELVDQEGLDVNVALKAQDAATRPDGHVEEGNIEVLVGEMKTMSGVQRERVTEVIKKDPTRPVDEAIEDARSAARITQITVTLTQSAHGALQIFARGEGTTQDEAAASLITQGLVERNFLEE